MAFVPSGAATPLPTQWAADIKAARSQHRSVPCRALTPAEIQQLKAQGNIGWAAVKVRQEPGGTFNASHVQRCTFAGPVTLGCFSSTIEVAPAIRVPCGVYDSVLAHVSVAGGAVVRHCQHVSHTDVLDGAALVACGHVSCSGPTAFANGMKVPLGLDGPGRACRLHASVTVGEAAALAQHSLDAAAAAAYAHALDGVVAAVTDDRTLVDCGARVTHCPRVVDVVVGRHAVLDNATVERATVLSGADGDGTVIAGGSVVRDALLQWHTHVDSMAVVEGSVMLEGSHVDRHGKLLESLLGPGSGVSEGEVSASLVGPLVGFHHQALLIAALWPEGKGNVGYGANVGSNHTSKAPDQEIRPGEGTFFGLGTCVKFPANYQASPYTVVATGVCALPQRLAFPFSLVNTPGESVRDLSPAINELTPGWVLSDSVYTVWRNQFKFQTRFNSKRHVVDTAVFRPHIVDLMVDARHRLTHPKGDAKHMCSKGKPVWTSHEIIGLGKNYLRDAARTTAIATYTRYIQLYAVAGVAALASGPDGIRVDLSVDDLAATVGNADTAAAHAVRVAAQEFGSVADVASLVDCHRHMMAHEWLRARDAKAKDARRGAKIIPDYNDVHPSADDDKVVAWLKCQATAGMTAKL